MIEKQIDIWEEWKRLYWSNVAISENLLSQHPSIFNKYAICITTNSVFKKDGSLVMGKGIALQAAEFWPWLPKELGFLVKNYGNLPFTLGERANHFGWSFIISFPTKYHWKDDSDIQLIKESAIRIKNIADHYDLKTVLLPRPGCGNGNLIWDNVRFVLENYFDDRFVVCYK